MTITIDYIEIKTNERLAGVNSLLHLLENAIPEYEHRKKKELLEFAQEQGLDAHEYFAEREIVEHESRFWLRRFAAYAVVTLLYTILGVHLRDCVRRAEAKTNKPFVSADYKGSRIERSATYLKNCCGYNLKEDPAWGRLKDLHEIRILVVHTAGTPVKQATATRLKAKYSKDFEHSKDQDDWWNEIGISSDLCRRFANDVKAFSEKCLSAVNALPSREES